MLRAISFASFLDNHRLSDTKGKSRRGGGGVDEERGRLRRPVWEAPYSYHQHSCNGGCQLGNNLLHAFSHYIQRICTFMK
jgi:hypothetical protein